jgi:putative membrane protein
VTLLAHGDPGPLGAQLGSTVLLAGLACGVCAAYLAGARRLAGAPEGSAGRSYAWRRWAFCAGAVVVVGALLPPLDPVVDASFPAHMVQHLVLVFVAAPLLALGAPGLPLLLALPRRPRRTVAALRGARALRPLRGPDALAAAGLAVFTGVLVVWHLPAVYSLALDSDPVHELEHACFLASAWLLWAPLAAPGRPLDGGRAVLYLFLGGFPMLPIGAVLVMATHPLYPAQTGTGPGALAAQQLAGVLMWVPPTFLTVGLCAAVVLRWFARMERTDPREAPLPPALAPALPDRLAHGELSR